ncbi:hypothetical protein ACGF12_06335 [Kitasatospora sp. NPDC048296]|uniref:hypothetical protein n=1 Tax=Kitasatospora sp. NPDC048296 TaxID=3364048 RepID=UPI00371A4A86
MAAREDTARDVRHEPERHGRHGRPRPFGGRFRLPTLRFSGAAMAMSTVVGISIATTLLLNEQQGIGRRAGVARVGSTPPPTPSATDQAEAAAERTPATPAPSGHPHDSRPTGHPSAHPSAPANAAATAPPAGLPAGTSIPVTPSTGGQASAGHEPRPSADTPGTGIAAGPSPSAQPSTPSDGPAGGQPQADPSGTGQPGGAPSPQPSGLRPVAPAHPAAEQPAPPVPARPVPPPAAAVPGDNGAAGGTDGAPGAVGSANSANSANSAKSANSAASTDSADVEADRALTGTGRITPLGRDGLRHALNLAVAEPVTALQAEFRLAPGELAPGSSAAWTDLPGAVVTVQQERGSLVYRFTTPPGTDVEPGHYSFAVRGTRPAEPLGPVRKSPPAESWNAAAFGIGHPRAVAALGGFGQLLPLPTQPLAPAPH